jgi:hypothetical protein
MLVKILNRLLFGQSFLDYPLPFKKIKNLYIGPISLIGVQNKY